ncbi:carbohydrate ABC transporter permease [Allonocardiopsis opalescens]|uniref:Raffinose/stachyose/melibiose transport system permease protein n=1 Tax=Allonocardiopsis opalescens TaxID=1144618 RepID=A0A2T0Q762_9ACTN|nr:sugar ABC transporter permease [Allonocardiopsis opalescens]PRX99634.1 raffinose/stachyose/melibiose transport system permease protein [Allonocardiopsis opalescens]
MSRSSTTAAVAAGGPEPSRDSGPSGRRGPRRPPRRRGRAPGEPHPSAAYLYIAPALIVYALFLLVPIGRSFMLSLYEWDGLTVGTWAGLDNYVEIATDPGLRAAFGHTAVLIVFYALIPVAVGMVLAAIVARARVRGMPFFRTAIFLPQVVALAVVAVTWRDIYASDGPINQVLRFVGLEELARAWLGDFALALPAVGLVGTWVNTGLCFVLFLAGTGKIPGELYQAVRVDGGGPIREFTTVTMPALRNEMVVALTLTVINALRTFDLVYLTTSGGPGNSTTVPAVEVFRQAFERGEVGSAAAVGITLTLIILALNLLISRIGTREAR